MTWLQFFVALVTALVAPAALVVQQRLQNTRENQAHEAAARVRQIAADAAAVEAERQGQERAHAELRDVYAAALRAVGRFRASAAINMTIVEQAAGDPARMVLSTAKAWGVGTPQPFPVAEYAQALEAVVVARLWVRPGDRAWVTDLESALRGAAASPIASGMTCQRAWDLWERLRTASEDAADAAQSDLRRFGAPGPA